MTYSVNDSFKGLGASLHGKRASICFVSSAASTIGSAISTVVDVANCSAVFLSILSVRALLLTLLIFLILLMQLLMQIVLIPEK